MVLCEFYKYLYCGVFILITLIESATGRSGLHSEESAPPSRVQQCREGCLEKFSTDDFACLQRSECSMCWDQCVTPTKINISIKDTWRLKIISMVRQESLVSADVNWPTLNDPSQCLVTWEVSGGGLMGNLLTDSSSVQLSLWPESKYRVQVTCKNKNTEEMTRSLPLTIDTCDAIIIPESITKNKDIIMKNKKNSNTNQTGKINYNIWSVGEKQREIMLGLCAAILVFLFILLIFIFNIKRTVPSDKETLLQNDVSLDEQTVHV